MTITSENEIPPKISEDYVRLAASIPDVELKGTSVVYTSFNGRMFSYLNSDGRMALKLPRKERKEFLNRYQTKLFEAYGVIQQQFVTVPQDLLERTEELRPYFLISFDSVRNLKDNSSS